MATKSRIGIIGNGNVGSAIAKGLRSGGYEVESCGKDPPKVKQIGERSEILFLAVPFAERENALRDLGATIQGKTLVDVTNSLTPNYEFAADIKKSGAEGFQEQAKGARVVKAFNTVFAENMSTGTVKGEPLTLFVAGDHEEAKREVEELGRAIGFEPVDAGPLKNARWLETLGFFNIQLGYNQKLGTDIGFKLVGATKSREESPPRTEKEPPATSQHHNRRGRRHEEPSRREPATASG